MNSNEQVSPDELASIRSALQEFEKGELAFHHPAIAIHSLTSLWQAPEPPAREFKPPAYLREAPPDSMVYKRRPVVPREREWDLGLSSEFRKAVRSIDRKLQGRVLQALDYITSKPTVARGDTVKPLGGDLKGLWRYRIGDYRLVYRPDVENRRVVLVSFVSRGGAYA